MPRLPGRRAVPWMVLLDAAMVARDHWGKLSDRDRRELARIVRKSAGRPRNLTAREREELKRLVKLLDLPRGARSLLPLRGGLRRGKR